MSGFFALLLDWLRRLFGRVPAPPPDNETERAEAVTRRVLLIVYDPIMDAANNITLTRKMNWRSVDDLVNGYSADIAEASGGLARYEIVDRQMRHEFPVKVGGFRFTPSTYMDVYNHINATHATDYLDYGVLLKEFNVLARVAANELDEVWVFAFPFAGLYESSMGGAGAFHCNSPVLSGTRACPRRFIIMGFSYERGVGEMLESFGHRAEDILEKVFARSSGAANLYNRFRQYDLIAPGNAHVGSIHYAPNSHTDYEWGSPRLVTSYCDDWYNFPNFKGVARQVNHTEWGGGDIRAHHQWWLKHLPKVAGRKNGVAHNWWGYIIDPNQVLL